MRATSIVALAAFAGATEAARADLLWDNGGFEEDAAYSSERNTLVPESWTVDDFVIAAPVVVREFQWTTLRGSLEPVGADLIVLTSDFRTIVELRDLPFAQEWLGESSFGLDLYGITLTDLDIALGPGRYYIGGRMVGEGGGRSFNGLRREIRAETEGYIRSEFFGIPDWAPVTEGLGRAYDMVFTVYGDVVPAPATLAPLLCGLLARRRRG